MIVIYASLADSLTNAVADISRSLRYPVLILALLALLVDFYELGRLAMETVMRRQASPTEFDQVARQAQATAHAGDVAGAQALLKAKAHGSALEEAYIKTLLSPTALDAERAAVEYDLHVSKRLDRVRLLVRSGPALGLMGTLIPLAPALAALGRGDAKVLTDELQTAFSITVVGVAVGLIAFLIAIVHERYYSSDLSNVDYLRQLRGDATVVIQTQAPALATTSVQAPGIPARPANAPPATAAVQPTTQATTPAQAAAPAHAAAPTQPVAPAQPAVPAQPVIPAQPAAAPKKKRFGVRRKQKGAAPPPVPPAVGVPPTAPGTGAIAGTPAAPVPAVPPPTAPPPTAPPTPPADKSPTIPTQPPATGGDDDPGKSPTTPTPPAQ